MNILLLALMVAAFNLVISEDLKVSTTSGIMVGRTKTTLGQKVKLFLGVPYAQAPVGSNRFKLPQALMQQREVDATHFQPSCFQSTHLASVISPLLRPNQIEISEDCLYLNIYVPSVSPKSQKLPVIVFLTGEGFDYADPHQFDGSFLAVQGKVIFITVSYRVSVFGFLSALNDNAPGNVGLYDQRMALKWINENIVHFGGDSSKITLSGRFSGAMSAAIHAFSPLSQTEKLFQRIILQSGVPVGDWVFDRNPLNATLSLAEKTNCLYLNLTETVECLRDIPSEELLNAARIVPHAWRPVLDFNLIYYDTMKEAAKGAYFPVDIMFGMNNNEGTLCTIGLKASKSPFYEKLVKNAITESDFEELINDNMASMYKTHNYALNKLAVYKYKYMTSSLRDNFIRFCGDLYVTSHLEKLADIVSGQNKKVFMYQLSHRASFSHHPFFVKAAHGDDVLFTTGLPLQLKKLPINEVKLTKRMITAVSNFAYYGNPNGLSVESSWPQFTPDDRFLMDFRADESSAVIRNAYRDVEDFFYNVFPIVADSLCPSPSMAIAEALTQENQDKSQSASFLGIFTSLTTSENIILGLLCIILLMFVVTGIAVAKARYSGFQRV